MDGKTPLERQIETYGGGAKPRYDGQGDGWANAHRLLGSGYLMSDLDYLIGHFEVGLQTENRLFVEYAADDFENHGNLIREYAFVAFFERKASQASVASALATPQRSMQLCMCRRLAIEQPKPPRFFYVVGSAVPPWPMYEVDINSGAVLGTVGTIESTEEREWRRLWARIGLTELRSTLSQWARERGRECLAKRAADEAQAGQKKLFDAP